MQLTKRAERIKSYATIKIADKVRELESNGVHIINLSVGEPHFPTLDVIKKATIRAIQENKTHYSQSRGIPELRELICQRLNDKYGSHLQADKNILITPGAKQAILYVILAIIEEGDEVLIHTPAWVSFFEMVNIAGGKIIQFNGSGKKDFNVTLNEVKKIVTKKTKLIILNSPNNPTGKIIDEKVLREISKYCIKRNTILLCDEIYDEIVFDKRKNPSLLSVNHDLDNAILINGFSKTYAMTGWRLGYVISTQDIINSLLKFQQHSITCPNTFTQFGAIVALKRGDSFIKKALSVYSENRNILVKGFEKLKNFKLIKPEGGLYGFIDVSKINNNSTDFCLDLLDRCRVAAVPGVEFGKIGEGHIRICLATDKKNIIEFLKRIKEVYE
jgi:aspartate/methionine/tyrosine aminotransferase